MLIKFRIEKRVHYFRVMRENRDSGTDILLMWITSAEYRKRKDVKVDLSTDNLVDALYLDDDLFNFRNFVVKLVDDKIDDLRREALKKKIDEVYRKGVDVGVDYDNLRPSKPTRSWCEPIGI